MVESVPVNVKVRRNGWIRVFFSGVGLYILTLFVMILTNNPNLFPTVVLIGNFLVPITYVAFFYERRHLSPLSLPSIAFVFFYGGLLGVLASALLEPIFVRQMNPLSAFTVGIIEEGAKIVGVMVISRRFQAHSEMDGLIMGAAVGMGFAALESMGYTFTVFLVSQGSLSSTVYVTLLRGFLSPVGHGTWTAIIASVLFRERKGLGFFFNGKVIGSFLLVAVLHGLWDGLPQVMAIFMASSLSLFIAQAVVGGIGLFILWLRYREARRLQITTSEGEHGI